MSELDAVLDELRRHPGVEHVLVLGRDGLLIQHVGESDLDAETVSAMVPGIANAAANLGGAANSGNATMVVARMESAVAIVSIVSAEVLLAVLLRDDVGFAPLLRAMNERQASLASLI